MYNIIDCQNVYLEIENAVLFLKNSQLKDKCMHIPITGKYLEQASQEQSKCHMITDNGDITEILLTVMLNH